jgi:outer membrane protein
MESSQRYRWTFLPGMVCPIGRAAVVCLTGVLLAAPAIAETFGVDDCVHLALARAPAARAAGFDVDAAAAHVRAARAAYTPRLLAQGEYGRSQGFDAAVTNGGSTAALLTVETTLLDGGLRDAQVAAAQARLQSATALERQRRADVAFAVRTAYFVALAARTEGEIQGDNLRTLRDAVELLQRQEALGLVPHNDVLRAQLAMETARTAQRAAAAQLDTVRSELAVLIGADVAAASLTEPAAVSFREATDAMIDTSPVMTDARAAVEAARRDADAVRSEWRGHVTLTASAGALGVQPGPTFEDNGGGQFLFGVSLPLFDGGAATARIAAAVAATHSTEANLQQSRQTIAVALARAGVEARRAQADLTAWERTVPSAEEDFQLMRARYFGGGNVRLLEVLDALSQYVDARRNVPRGLLAYRLAVATEEQILGEVTP